MDEIGGLILEAYWVICHELPSHCDVGYIMKKTGIETITTVPFYTGNKSGCISAFILSGKKFIVYEFDDGSKIFEVEDVDTNSTVADEFSSCMELLAHAMNESINIKGGI